MPGLCAEGKDGQQEVEGGFFLVYGQWAHGGQLLPGEGDIYGLALSLRRAEHFVAEPGDESQNEGGGNKCGGQPAHPGDALAGHFRDDGHADGIGAHGGVEEPGVGGVGIEVRQHNCRIALMLAAFVAQALADAVADGAYDCASGGIGGDHQGQDGVRDVCGVVCHEFGFAHLGDDPIGDPFAKAGMLD